MSQSQGSVGGNRDKKGATRQRAADRRLKLDAMSAEVDPGHIVNDSREGGYSFQLPNFSEMGPSGSALDRASSVESTGSLLYGKTPTSGALLGKSSSLIFPTGIDSNPEDDSEAAKTKRRKVNMALDQCEAVRFPFKKKLILEKLELTASDLPIKDLAGTSLGNSLHKLSLSGNRLGTVPAKLIQSLPILKHLNLSQCDLSQLPDKWNLPKLTRLNLSHNGFTEFPEEVGFACACLILLGGVIWLVHCTHNHFLFRFLSGRQCWKAYQSFKN